MSEHDASVRNMVMDAIRELSITNGGWVTRADLTSLVLADGTTRRAIDQSRGIWNPRDLDATLSVLSSPTGPYADAQVATGLYRYSYRSGSGTGGDNRKLIRAYELQLPIVLLIRLDLPGHFAPVFPCYVTDNDPVEQVVYIAVDAPAHDLMSPNASELERNYAERTTRQRLHQAAFRGQVLLAYESTCAVCRLRHPEFLDAAHIIADSHERGDAIVPNGLTLCKIHHAAYDRNLMGISPEYRVHIDLNLLDEIDGPMLKHGLQEMHGQSITVPRARRQQPDRERLDVRFRAFQDRQSC
ncbi:MAG: HNH endonuclease [Cumulibacter sp.]